MLRFYTLSLDPTRLKIIETEKLEIGYRRQNWSKSSRTELVVKVHKVPHKMSRRLNLQCFWRIKWGAITPATAAKERQVTGGVMSAEAGGGRTDPGDRGKWPALLAPVCIHRPPTGSTTVLLSTIRFHALRHKSSVYSWPSTVHFASFLLRCGVMSC